MAYDLTMLSLLERYERMQKQGKVKLALEADRDAFTDPDLEKLEHFITTAVGVAFQRVRLDSLKQVKQVKI